MLYNHNFNINQTANLIITDNNVRRICAVCDE